MTDLTNLASTAHVYTGGSGGPLSLDGDRGTRYYSGGALNATHTFATPVNVKAVTVYSYAYGNANEDGGTYASGYTYCEYTLNNVDWIVLGDRYIMWDSQSRGGRGDIKITLDQTLYPVDFSDVLAVRIRMSSAGYSGHNVSAWEFTVYGDTGFKPIVMMVT